MRTDETDDYTIKRDQKIDVIIRILSILGAIFIWIYVVSTDVASYEFKNVEVELKNIEAVEAEGFTVDYDILYVTFKVQGRAGKVSGITEDSIKFFSKTAIGKMKIHKSSVDARKKTDIQFVYSVAAEIEDGADDETLAANGIVPTADEKMEIRFGDKPLSDRPIVVGFGPCGMFCALILAENGYRPIVIERGSA